jgi:hypothetical protein
MAVLGMRQGLVLLLFLIGDSGSRRVRYTDFHHLNLEVKVMLRQTISQYVVVSSSLWNP